MAGWALGKLHKPHPLSAPEPSTGHWRTWPEGKPIGVGEEWLSRMINEGRLPGQVTYAGAREDEASMRATTGTHVIVEMLDADRKTRHRCILLSDTLIATRPDWDASLEALRHLRLWPPARLLASLRTRRTHGQERGKTRDRASAVPGRRLPSPAWHSGMAVLKSLLLVVSAVVIWQLVGWLS
jgi:hypothetical protein